MVAEGGGEELAGAATGETEVIDGSDLSREELEEFLEKNLDAPHGPE